MVSADEVLVGHTPPIANFIDFDLVMHSVFGARTDSTNFFSVFAQLFAVLVASTTPVRLMQMADGGAPSAGDGEQLREARSARMPTPAQPRRRGTSFAKCGLRRVVAMRQPYP